VCGAVKHREGRKSKNVRRGKFGMAVAPRRAAVGCIGSSDARHALSSDFSPSSVGPTAFRDGNAAIAPMAGVIRRFCLFLLLVYSVRFQIVVIF
jgi:hypothetical protein